MKGRKWMVVTVLAAALIVPTGAYAGYTYLADAIYGSKQQAEAMWGAGMDYERLEAKLQSIKHEVSEEEYESFIAVMKRFSKFAAEHGDADGTVDPKSLSKEEQLVYEDLARQLEPVFEKMAKVETPLTEAQLMSTDRYWLDKINEAERSFTIEELKEFKALLERIRSYEGKSVDEYGNFDAKRLTAEEQADVKELKEKITPYLERLGISQGEND
ncbi:putative DUF3600 domain-containing protein [Paenibacillus sp. 598K]|nr:putative DUF3600 domain-containing protein [Paenibacillus sp. 598K]